MFTLNNTDNFYYRLADFLNDLPVYADELESYKGDINKLVMNLTEGIDRGKARADGGIENVKTWNNLFIMTGEHTASSTYSGGGTLNRLIELSTEEKIIENGSEIVSVILKNYGFAGKKFIEYVKSFPQEELENTYNALYDSLSLYKKTEEKQALNMAVLLFADFLACNCIFTENKPLEAKDVADYMFSKEEIDVSQRAYDEICNICAANKNKFYIFDGTATLAYPANNAEVWGKMSEYKIIINKNRLDKILQDNRFSPKKTLKDWIKKGYIEKTDDGRNYKRTSIDGVKADYITIVLS